MFLNVQNFKPINEPFHITYGTAGILTLICYRYFDNAIVSLKQNNYANMKMYDFLMILLYSLYFNKV